MAEWAARRAATLVCYGPTGRGTRTGHVCVCGTRLSWGRCQVSGHSPTSRAGSRDIGRQRSSGRPGT
eukprot:573649-Prymnesium_polylepis.1